MSRLQHQVAEASKVSNISLTLTTSEVENALEDGSTRVS